MPQYADQFRARRTGQRVSSPSAIMCRPPQHPRLKKLGLPVKPGLRAAAQPGTRYAAASNCAQTIERGNIAVVVLDLELLVRVHLDKTGWAAK